MTKRWGNPFELTRERGLSGKPVVIVEYGHRHGSDYFVYSSEDNAFRGMCALIVEWIEDIDDAAVRAELKKLILKNKHRKALELWNEWQEGRWTGEYLVRQKATIDDLRGIDELFAVLQEPEEEE
jgi:hypothetical protein